MESQIIDSISYIPKYLTQQITYFISKSGFNVTDSWSRILLYTISLLLIYAGMKISKPIVKWLIIMFSIVLIIGIWIPW